MNRIVYLFILFWIQSKVIGQTNDFGLNIIRLYSSEFNNKNLIDISDFKDDLINNIKLSFNHRIHIKNDSYLGYEINYGISETKNYSIESMATLEVVSYSKNTNYGVNILYGHKLISKNKYSFNLAGLIGYSFYPKYYSETTQTSIKNTEPNILHSYTALYEYPKRQMYYLGFRLNFHFKIYQNVFLNLLLDNYFKIHSEHGITQNTYKGFTIENNLISENITKTEINRSLISSRLIKPSVGIFFRF